MLAPALLAANLQFGPPMAVSKIGPGDPLSERLVNAWGDGPNVVAVVTRSTFDHHQAVRMTIGPSGSADASTVAQLPIPSDVYVAAPLGDAMMVVWSDQDGTKAQFVDAKGQPLAPPVAVPAISSPRAVACNGVRCVVSQTNRAAIIDAYGQPVATVNGPMSSIVVGPHGFFMANGNQVTLLDNDGKSVATATVPSAQTILYAGTHFLAAGVDTASHTIEVWTIDPDTGAAAHAATVDYGMTFGDWSVDRFSLVASDSGYLAMFHVSPPAAGPSAFTATMRLTSSFGGIDLTPQQVASDPTTLTAVGVTGGIRLLAQTGTLPLRWFLSGSNATSLFSDGASQSPVAAAASPSATLGVWTETAGDHLDLLAARIDRAGHAIDVAPLVLASATSFLTVRAASNGSGFAVVWQDDRGRLGGVTIDGGVPAVPFTITSSGAALKWPIRIVAVDGAYQLAFFVSGAVMTATITPPGQVTLHAGLAISASGNSIGVASFDGHRTVALWADGGSLYSATSDGALSGVQVPRGVTVTGVDLAPNGNDFIALISTWDQTGLAAGNVTYLNGLTSSGMLTRDGLGVAFAPAGVAADYRLIRIDGAWYVTWLAQLYSVTGGVERNLAPFDPTTLAAGVKSAIDTGHNFANDVVSGYGGEAILVDAADVPVTSGYAAQMTVQSIRALTAHKRAAGR